jgi:hypothetical protein
MTLISFKVKTFIQTKYLYMKYAYFQNAYFTTLHTSSVQLVYFLKINYILTIVFLK